MTDPALLIRQFLAARDARDVARIAHAAGFHRLVWQSWRPGHVLTWDALPEGFFQHYYGVDADRHCAVANAIRANWHSFTFAQARSAFGARPGAADAERVWRAFGIEDGIVVVGGEARRKYIGAFMTPRPIGEEARGRAIESLTLAAQRLDTVLMRDEDYVAIPRPPVVLSPRQLDVLNAQIEHPHLGFEEQARLLGISPRMLARRHQQIAQRFGVSSFAGAVARAASEAIAVSTGRD